MERVVARWARWVGFVGYTLIVALTLALPARPARAQSLTVDANPATVTRRFGYRKFTSSSFALWVNRDECEEGDVFQFVVSATGDVTNTELEVWAGTGTNCAEAGQRSGSGATCWQVAATTLTAASNRVAVPARNLVARAFGPHDVTLEADPSVCDLSTPNRQEFDLYFLLFSSGEVVGKGAVITGKMGFDVTPPSPPGDVEAVPGEGAVHFSWTSSTSPDVTGYELFCDPGVRTTQTADGGSNPNALPPGAEGIGSTSDASAESTEGATAEAGSDAGGDAGRRSLSCAPTALTPGERPDPKYLCGYSAGHDTSGIAKGLANDHRYVVGVAAVDPLGNVGVLSKNVCVTPVEILDFFELYRNAGGKGGGCSMTRAASASTSSSVVGATAAGILVGSWRRRRRARPSRCVRGSRMR